MKLGPIVAAVVLGICTSVPSRAESVAADKVAASLARGAGQDFDKALGYLRETTDEERAALIPRFVELASNGEEEPRIAALRALQELGPGAASAYESIALIGLNSRGSLRAAAAMAGLAINPSGQEVVRIAADVVRAGGAEAIAVLRSMADMERVPGKHREILLWSLTATSPAMRLAATRAIVRLDPPIERAPEALLVSATDAAVAEEREAARKALESWADDPEVIRLDFPATKRGVAGGDAALLTRLRGDLIDPDKQLKALKALAKLGPAASEAFGSVARVANDARTRHRLAAVETLGAIGPKRRSDFEALLRIAAQGSEAHVLKAQEIIRKSEPVKGGIEAFAAGVESKSEGVQAVSGRALGRWARSSPSAWEAFRRANRGIQADALFQILECQSGPEGAARVASRLTSKRQSQRWTAISGLFRCGPLGVPELVRAVALKDLDARAYALLALEALAPGNVQLRIPDLSTVTWTGVGVAVDLFGRPPTLSLIAPGGPADKAGLEPDDRLDAINGKPTEPMNDDEILEALKGAAGSTVTLKVSRWSVPEGLQVTLRRTKNSIATPRPSVTPDVLRRLGRLYGYAEPALKELAATGDVEVREAARLALKEAASRDRGGVADNRRPAPDSKRPALSESSALAKMGDPEPEVRLYGIRAAGQLAPSAPLVSALRRAVADPANHTSVSGVSDRDAAPTLQHAALLSLENYGDAAKPGLYEVVRAYNDGDGVMKSIALRILKKLGLDDPGTGGVRTNPAVREFIRKLEGKDLQEFRSRASELVGPLLDDAVSGDARAVRKLSELCPEAGEVLGAALSSSSPQRRLAASKALFQAARIPSSAAPALAGAVRDEDVIVRLNAVRAMGWLPVRAGAVVRQALNEARGDADPEVRAAAESALEMRERAAEQSSGHAER